MVAASGSMASVDLQPPSPFVFKNPDEWPRWKRRFEQFHLASGLSTENDERQVSILLYCMGEEAEDTFASTNITTADKKKYKLLRSSMASSKSVRTSLSARDLIVVTKGKMNLRNSSSLAFISWWKTAYGDLKDEMIRDRIVGIRDSSLSEKL